MKEENKIPHLVLDTGAFISCSFDTLASLAVNLYTCQDVLDEIRDKATRQRLASMVPIWTLVEPDHDDVVFIAQFSKSTGDYGHLSATDLKVLALTATLQKRHVSDDYRNSKPKTGEVVKKGKSNHIVELAGFYSDVKKKENSTAEAEKFELSSSEDTNRVVGTDDKEDDQVDSDASSDGEWITPSNISKIKKKMSNFHFDDGQEKEERPVVACSTVDFAMQNVLLQLGLPILSPIEGRLIKRCSQFILRCHACAKLCTNLSCKFCPSCGNLGTLKKVCVTTDSDGNKQIHINFKRPINVRGKKYSMPMPKGGKHSTDPIVVADQPIPQMRAAKAAVRDKKMVASTILDDPTYTLRSNPFSMNDVTSRASQFHYLPGTKATQLVGLGQNPNAMRKGKHKK